MKKNGWIRSLAITLLLAVVFTSSVYAEGKKVDAKNVPVYKITENGTVHYYSVNGNGEAVQLTGMKELAAKRLASLKAGKKKSWKNLRKAFKWSAKLRYRNNTRRLKGSEAAEYYGRYGFMSRSGDCNTAAYTFCWMAQVLGYDAKVVQGRVPSGSMSNLKNHAWVTIKSGKKTWYFDPDFNRTYAGKTVRTSSGIRKLGKYCGFKFLYGTPGTYKYVK